MAVPRTFSAWPTIQAALPGGEARALSWAAARGVALLLVAGFVMRAATPHDGPNLSVAMARADDADEEEADDENPYRPGVIARYRGADGVEHVRLEERIFLSDGDSPQVRRVGAGPFEAVFEGHLLVQSPGKHRLRVYASGNVQVTLRGRSLFKFHSPQPAWHASETVDLPFGFHELVVRYRRDDEPARLSVFWEGPNFALESLASRWLFHEREHTPPENFERGQRLVRALRCAACHDLPGERAPLAAPALDRLSGNLSPSWLVERLTENTVATTGRSASDRSSRNMPHFGMTHGDAEAVADYLFSASKPLAPAVSKQDASPAANRSKSTTIAKSGKAKKKDQPPEPPSAAAGATLFLSVGCLACHRVGELGTDGPFGGGDLTAVVAKRPRGFFSRWLADPAAINGHHRMPVFALSPAEIASLSLYLETLGSQRADSNLADSNLADSNLADSRPANVARGAELVRAFRCGGCHELPHSDEPPVARLPLDVSAAVRGNGGCLSQPDAAGRRPGYRLDEQSRQAVAEYLNGIANAPDAERTTAGDLLAENNCLACHARGHAPGLTPHLSAVAEADASLRAAVPLMIPPALVGVGDKLHDEALVAAITATGAKHQEWLRVRMPKFPLSKEETATLVRHFVDADRIPDMPGATGDTSSAVASEIEGAGARLVTADGFGCTSCHAIGQWTPQKVAPGAEGARLSNIGKRVRREWFDRWVRNPVRIVPQMEMPSLVQPIRGVLDDDLDRQIAAIWHVLNRKGFTPPAPNALRVVRRSNQGVDPWQAAVLTDVIEVGDTPFVKPIVIGFHNRHNVLYDLATGRLAAWWTGDTARQRTRGKTWIWEAGVPQLLPHGGKSNAGDDGCELVLLVDGQRIEAVPRGQYLTEFDWFGHEMGGIAFTHRLDFPLSGKTVTVRLTQHFAPWSNLLPRGPSGFRRQVEIDDLPDGVDCELLVLPGDVVIHDSGRSLTGGTESTRLKVSTGRWDRKLAKTARGGVVKLTTANGQLAMVDLNYRADLVVDQFAPLPSVDRRVKRATLDVVPGFEAVRLPLSDQPMPTGLAWRPDGTLIVSSLEGRVWLARDTDADGLEDQIEPFSDDLAAPYGVAAAGEAIDVINKYGLLRLFDDDGDGRAERTEQIASGWGHTRDYHDWVVGLPRDGEGNYYVSVPCEQDHRSESAAHLRGRVLKLIPRAPTRDDPRRFALEEICAGLRFPQGIARDPEGELFVTDNQGNYNPFNELNHVVRGARYGFINSLEAKRGLNPPATAAAIEIPHPWTRSVNGICFLVAPESAGKTSEALYGPLAGHLVGCEYDTRRLVRMSLERVGDTYQGAVYPLSIEPAAGTEALEGPIACQISPNGDLYIGNVRDSGWGGGSNTGSIVRLRRRGELPAGIAEVRARARGFTIEFAQPVDPELAADGENYAISSYRRIATPAYGGEDVDRRVEKIARVAAAADGRSATVDVSELREGFVYELHLRKLASDRLFFPDEAYYTLQKRPGG